MRTRLVQRLIRLSTSIGLLAVLCVSSLHAHAATQLEGSKKLIWRDYLGVNAHFLWFTPQQYRQQIEQLKQLGLEWVRIDVHWDRHETAPGQYRLAELDQLMHDLSEQQLKPLVYVVGSAPHATSAPKSSKTPDQYPPKDTKLFAELMAKMAQRYPNVEAWQVWNEQNLPSFWRPYENPQQYGQLLLDTTRALRASAPDKPVVMGGMAYYSQMPVRGGLMFEALGQLGVQQLKTIMAYHPYTEFPEGNTPKDGDFLVHSGQLNQLLRSGEVPAIWATEWGWSSYSGPKELQAIIGEDGQADFMLRRLALMSAGDFDRTFLFALSDLDSRASVRDQSYGLLSLDGQPKAAYRALENFLLITGANLLPTAKPAFISMPKDLYSVSWQREDGKQLLMFWSASKQPIKLKGIQQAQLHNPLTGEQRELKAAESVLEAPSLSSLQLLVW